MPYTHYFYCHRLIPHIGATQDLPAKSCKEIRDVRANECDCTLSSGMYWVNHTDPCMKLPTKVIKVSNLNCNTVTSKSLIADWYLIGSIVSTSRLI